MPVANVLARGSIVKYAVLRAALVAAGLLSFTASAYAQTAATSAGNDENLEEITVTGSRVIANGNDAPTPVTVLRPDDVLTTKPTTLYENLVDLPVFSGSRGAVNGGVSSSPNAAGGNQPNGAVSSLNLRNMGPLRTLVLFDGHRVPPVSPDGLVDPSTLPQMLIQRVDVVTGGVSAVYGSDAITGAVNFVTDSNFNGVKVQLQNGSSEQNDGDAYQVGIAAGTDLFGGRGHIEASYQHMDSDPLYEYERNKWTKYRWSVQGNGTTVPWALRPYVTNTTASFGGSIACPSGAGLPNPGSVNPANCPAAPNVGLTFKENGVWSQYDPGTRDGLTQILVQNGGDGAYFVNVAMKSAQVTDQFFTRFDYDLTDDLHAYIAAAWNSNEVAGNVGTQRTFTPGVNIGACNAFLDPAYQALLGCTDANRGTASEPTFKFEKQFNSLDNHGMGQNNEFKNDSYYVLAALDGSLGENYRWDVSYSHSESELKVSALNQNRQQIYAALDAVVNPANGQIVCGITLTNPSILPDCVPMNLFGPTAMTKEMAYYFVDTITNTTNNKLDSFAGSIAGAPLNSWAGPIDMAFSAEFRKLTMDLDTTSQPTDRLNCTGLRFGNCNPNLPVHPNTWAPISGVSQKIIEAAYEFNMPLIRSESIFKEVNLNGAVRYAEYDNDPNDSDVVSRSFNATTWKAGITWDINDSLTLRWTRSHDFRAPSLYDLYLPIATGNTTNGTDYLLGGIATSPRLRSGGNPLLDPEVADTTTLGIVYRPTADISLSVDAYRISLSDALFQLNGLNQVVQEACYASGGSSSLCQLQERANNSFTDTSASNIMTFYYQRFVNIAKQKTEGVDFEGSFSTELFDRPLTLRALVTYQPHLKYFVPFAATQDAAGVAYPRVGGLPAPVWKASAFVNYRLSDRLNIDLSRRFRSSLRWSSDPSAPEEIGGVPSVSYTNLTVSYDVPTSLQQVNVFLNVQNLFDTDPPPAGMLNAVFPGQPGSNYAIGDDVMGRYYTLGVRIRL